MKQATVWSRNEKALLGISALVVIVGIVFIQSLRHRDDLPAPVIPTPRLPSPNAFDYFNRASGSIKDDTKMNYAIVATHQPSPYTSDDRPYSQAEKEALVRENAPVFATLRRGFAFPYANPPARSFSALFPYYAKERNLARLLTLESQTRAGRGDWGGAVSSNLDAIQMGVMVPHGGVLIGSLVGIACEAIGRKPVWSTYRRLNAAQARAAAHRMERLVSKQVPFADTVQEEEWCGQAGLLEILRSPHWSHDLAGVLSGSGTFSNRLFEAQLQLTPKRRILEGYTRYMNRAVAEARKPYAVAPSLPLIPSDPISQILVPDFNLARLKAVDNQTQDALLTTTLALWAYCQTRGAYPVTLASLVPADLKAVPNDPFAVSGPLHYRKTRTGYALYSVGPDGKDDGGSAILDASEPAPSSPVVSDRRRFPKSDSQGDIVAGLNL